MPLLSALKQSLARSQQPGIPKIEQRCCNKASLACLPDELIELIAIRLNAKDLKSLRLSSKRLAIVTTHLIVRYCQPHRICKNGVEGLKTLIKGGRIPLLNGSVSSLTLSGPNSKSPLAIYGTSIRDIRLLRLTYLCLISINIVQGSDLLHLLTAHAQTLRQLCFQQVRLPDLTSWRDTLVLIASMHRMKTLELVKLYYNAEHGSIWLLPHSTYARGIVALARRSGHLEEVLNGDDPVFGQEPRKIKQLIDGFFCSSGELQKDFGHEQMLAAEEAENWAQTMKRRLLGAKKY